MSLLTSSPTTAPDIQRPGAMGGEKDHQAAEQANQIVMIQIGRLIQEFDIRKAQKKESDANAVKATERDAEGKHGQQNKVRIHQRIGPRMNPLETGVGKVKGRFEIELADPAFGDEADHGGGHQQA